MLISIDHGNKQIKTSRRTFVSGLRESDTKPPFGKEVLFYKGKYYTLTDQRIPYMRDKTVDERYFILTLFAVAFELAGTDYRKDEIADVQLSIGLPPAHYGAQYERFENYFLNRDIIDFQLDGKPYSIFISKAVCFPQAYAAIMPIYQRLRQYPKVAVLDIGGFTADYLLVKNGEADLSACDSLDNGVITRDQYDHAWKVCDELCQYLEQNKDDVVRFCNREYIQVMFSYHCLLFAFLCTGNAV